MSDETPQPMPAEGGSYIRQPDGALERVVDPTAEAPSPPTEPQGPAPITPTGEDETEATATVRDADETEA